MTYVPLMQMSPLNCSGFTEVILCITQDIHCVYARLGQQTLHEMRQVHNLELDRYGY